MSNLKTSFLILLLIPFSLVAQVETASNETDSTASSGEATSEFYIQGSLYQAFRSFEDNTPFQSQAARLDETGINTGGVEVGAHIDFSRNVYLTIGVAFFSGGEEYQYNDTDSDSTFYYMNRYRHVGVPLRLNAQFGNTFQVYGFGGVIPSSILHRQYTSNFTQADGVAVENDVVTSKKDIASFQVVGSFGGGLRYRFDGGSIYSFAEYRPHFTTTYQNDFIVHKMHAMSYGVGLSLKFN